MWSGLLRRVSVSSALAVRGIGNVQGFQVGLREAIAKASAVDRGFAASFAVVKQQQQPVLSTMRSVGILGGNHRSGVEYLQRRWSSSSSNEIDESLEIPEDGELLTPDKVDPRLKDIYEAMVKEDYDEAIVLSHHKLRDAETTQDTEFMIKVLLIIANCHSQTNEPQTAIKYYKRVIALDSRYTEFINFQIGRCYVDIERFDLAEQVFTELLKTSPGRIDCLLERARAFQEQEKEEQAIADYNSALNAEPNNVIAMLGLGKLFADKEEFEEAYKWYSKALEVDPKCYIAHNAIAVIHFGNQDIQSAMESMNKAVEATDEEDPTILCQRASMHLVNQSFEKCIEDCDKAIALAPEYGLAYFSRAEALYFLGKWRLAIKYFEQFLSDFPEYRESSETPFADIFTHIAVSKLHILSGKWLIPDTAPFLEDTPETKEKLQEWEKALKLFTIPEDLPADDKTSVQEIMDYLAKAAHTKKRFGGDVLYEDLGRLFYALVRMYDAKPKPQRKAARPIKKEDVQNAKDHPNDVKDVKGAKDVKNVKNANVSGKK